MSSFKSIGDQLDESMKSAKINDSITERSESENLIPSNEKPILVVDETLTIIRHRNKCRLCLNNILNNLNVVKK